MEFRRALLPFLLILPLALFGCSRAAEKQPPEVEALVRDNTGFAFDLYRKLAAPEGNVFFSPYSISTALAMTYAGARGNTEKEMAATLHFSLGQAELHPAFGKIEARLRKAQKSGSIRLNVANSLWPQKDYPFLEDYLSLIKKHYRVSITPVDYKQGSEAACKLINGWVEEKTQARIKNLIQPGVLDEQTRLVLVNAIYFRGKWESQFKTRNTENASFHVTADSAVQVPMMHQEQKYRYASLPSLDILELPYLGGEMSMIVLLPKEVNGVRALERELSADNLRGWLAKLKKQEVLVLLPRFKTACMFRLDDTLKAMGMIDAFTVANANLAGMDGRPGSDGLYISAALHKAFVEVNEEGTEAAGATVVESSSKAIDDLPTFSADHPFVFLIQEKRTGSILFMGRLSDPAKNQE